MIRILFLYCFLGFTHLLGAQTFASEPNIAIPDDGTTIFEYIEVSGLPDVSGSDFGLIQVCVNVDHTYDSDLDVKLIAPDGTNFTLFAGIGGGGLNFTNTCLSMDAAQHIYESQAPFTGTFIPTGDMGTVNNAQNPNGTWSLQLYDTYAFADAGFLYSWEITFGENAPIAIPFPGTNLPLVKIWSGENPIGDEPKVEALMQIVNHDDGTLNFFADTIYEYEGKILTEFQGFSGPGYPKKNYDLDLIDSLGVKIDTTLLGLPAENDWIFKAEYLDPTLMYNSLAYEFSRRMGRYAPRTRYCELFLDGDYKGVYSLTEKVKRDNNRLDIAKLNPEDTLGTELTGGYIFEMNINGEQGDWNSVYPAINFATCNLPVEFKHVEPKSSEIHPLQHAYLKQFVDDFENTIHQNNYADLVEGYSKWIDVGSFIDFMLINEITVNYDSYGRSTYLYKDKANSADSLIHIGPPWDYDRGFCCVEGWVWEITHTGWPFPDWWSILHSDEAFLEKEKCRWEELRAGIFSNEEIIAYVDSLQILLQDAGPRSYQRWPELGVTNYYNSVAFFKELLTARLEWMDLNFYGIGNYDCNWYESNEGASYEEFEGAVFPPNCWNLIDADQDGSMWSNAGNTIGYNGGNCAYSYSFTSNLISELPDNYLITPQLSPLNNEHLSFYVAAYNGYEENIQVVLSTSGAAVNDFNIILLDEVVSGIDWRLRAVDLSEWWGQNIYIAFRHHDSGGNLALKLDHIQYPTWTNPGQVCIYQSVAEENHILGKTYPNPFGEKLNITLTNEETGDLIIQLYNTLGELIIDMEDHSHKNHIEVDTQGLVAGVYTMSIVSNKGKSMMKVVKQ
jgi:subtilisin-like proprotein convertase family protein